MGSDHLGAAANYEDQIEMKSGQENVINPSNAPIVAAEAISMEAVNEDDEQTENDNLDDRAYNLDHVGEDQSTVSETAEQTLQASADSSNTPPARDQDLVSSSTAVLPGYVPSELDERIVFELPSSMVRPLRVIRGTFQVSFTKFEYLSSMVWHLFMKLFHATFYCLLHCGDLDVLSDLRFTNILAV